MGRPHGVRVIVPVHSGNSLHGHVICLNLAQTHDEDNGDVVMYQGSLQEEDRWALTRAMEKQPTPWIGVMTPTSRDPKEAYIFAGRTGTLT